MKNRLYSPVNSIIPTRLIELYKSKHVDISDRGWALIVAKEMFTQGIIDYKDYAPAQDDYGNDITKKKVNNGISRQLQKHTDISYSGGLNAVWIKRYCKYFGCSADYLLGMIDNPTHAQNDNVPLTLNAINHLKGYNENDDEWSQGILSTVNTLLDKPLANSIFFWIGMYSDVKKFKGYISKGKRIPFTEPRKSNPKQIIHNDLFVYTDSDEQVMIDDDVVRVGILNKIRAILDNIDDM